MHQKKGSKGLPRVVYLATHLATSHSAATSNTCLDFASIVFDKTKTYCPIGKGLVVAFVPYFGRGIFVFCGEDVKKIGIGRCVCTYRRVVDYFAAFRECTPPSVFFFVLFPHSCYAFELSLRLPNEANKSERWRLTGPGNVLRGALFLVFDRRSLCREAPKRPSLEKVRERGELRRLSRLAVL